MIPNSGNMQKKWQNWNIWKEMKSIGLDKWFDLGEKEKPNIINKNLVSVAEWKSKLHSKRVQRQVQVCCDKNGTSEFWPMSLIHLTAPARACCYSVILYNRSANSEHGGGWTYWLDISFVIPTRGFKMVSQKHEKELPYSVSLWSLE